MKQNKGLKYAYLAGVIDSDGCIAIKKSKKGKTWHYSLQVLVNQADGRMADYLFGAFGGKVYKTKAYQKGRKEIYRWQVTCKQAAKICKRLIPFLRYKKPQAELAVRFDTIIDNQTQPTKNGVQRHRAKELEPHELALREECYQQMRSLKKEFMPSAAVTTKRDDSSGDEKR